MPPTQRASTVTVGQVNPGMQQSVYADREARQKKSLMAMQNIAAGDQVAAQNRGANFRQQQQIAAEKEMQAVGLEFEDKRLAAQIRDNKLSRDLSQTLQDEKFAHDRKLLEIHRGYRTDDIEKAKEWLKEQRKEQLDYDRKEKLHTMMRLKTLISTIQRTQGDNQNSERYLQLQEQIEGEQARNEFILNQTRDSVTTRLTGKVSTITEDIKQQKDSQFPVVNWTPGIIEELDKEITKVSPTMTMTQLIEKAKDKSELTKYLESSGIGTVEAARLYTLLDAATTSLQKGMGDSGVAKTDIKELIYELHGIQVTMAALEAEKDNRMGQTLKHGRGITNGTTVGSLMKQIKERKGNKPDSLPKEVLMEYEQELRNMITEILGPDPAVMKEMDPSIEIFKQLFQLGVEGENKAGTDLDSLLTMQ
jgi:hypothetical protein